MLRSIEFDLFTKIEANARFASRAGMHAKSKRTADQRAAVRAMLMTNFGAQVPPRYVQIGPTLAQNRIEVRLTRISPGQTADAWENLRGALKGVKDAIAAWIGLDDREGAGITWLDPRQEKQGAGVYRVRIEIADLASGVDRKVTLAEVASAGRLTKARTKKMIKTSSGIKRTGRVQSYQSDAAARGASSAARGGAERAFAKLTGAHAAPTIESLTSGQRDAMAGVIEHHYGKPTALDLRDAAERTLSRPRHRAHRGPVFTEQHRANLAAGRLHDDPGEERAARDLAACTTCGVGVGWPCQRLATDGTALDWPMLHGVHVARARVAGLHVPAHVQALGSINGYRDVKPGNGVRKVATQLPRPSLKAYLREPWRQRACGECKGEGVSDHLAALHATCCGACGGRGNVGNTLMHEPALDGIDPVLSRAYKVPSEHRAQWGVKVTLTRSRFEHPKLGVVWLYT